MNRSYLYDEGCVTLNQQDRGTDRERSPDTVLSEKETDIIKTQHLLSEQNSEQCQQPPDHLNLHTSVHGAE